MPELLIKTYKISRVITSLSSVIMYVGVRVLY